MPPLRMDRGARSYKCDFQVHTPRDANWGGEFASVVSDAAAEKKPDGNDYAVHEKLVVFPGIELTLSEPPCQALLLFDPKLSDAALQQVWGALGVAPFPS